MNNKKYRRQYYLKNKEQSAEDTKRWRLAHPKEAAAMVRKYQHANTEKVYSRNRRYIQSHPEKAAEYHRRYAEKHPETTIIRLSPRYLQWRLDIFSRDNYTCQECGKREYLEAHHHKKGFTQLLRECNINTYGGALKCDELWELDCGKTLCEECHNLTRGKRKLNFV